MSLRFAALRTGLQAPDALSLSEASTSPSGTLSTASMRTATDFAELNFDAARKQGRRNLLVIAFLILYFVYADITTRDNLEHILSARIITLSLFVGAAVALTMRASRRFVTVILVLTSLAILSGSFVIDGDQIGFTVSLPFAPAAAIITHAVPLGADLTRPALLCLYGITAICLLAVPNKDIPQTVALSFTLCAWLGRQLFLDARTRENLAYREFTVRQRVRQSASMLADQRRFFRGLMNNVLPPAFARRVLAGEERIAERVSGAALFLTMSWRPEYGVQLLDAMIGACDELCRDHGMTKVKSIGPTLLVVNTEAKPAGATLRFVTAVAQAMAELGAAGGYSVTTTAGIDYGTLALGVLGTRRKRFDVLSSTVNQAARLAAKAQMGEVLMSTAFLEQLPEGDFSASRMVKLKGLGQVEAHVLVTMPPTETEATHDVRVARDPSVYSLEEGDLAEDDDRREAEAFQGGTWRMRFEDKQTEAEFQELYRDRVEMSGTGSLVEFVAALFVFGVVAHVGTQEWSFLTSTVLPYRTAALVVQLGTLGLVRRLRLRLRIAQIVAVVAAAASMGLILLESPDEVEAGEPRLWPSFNVEYQIGVLILIYAWTGARLMYYGGWALGGFVMLVLFASAAQVLSLMFLHVADMIALSFFSRSTERRMRRHFLLRQQLAETFDLVRAEHRRAEAQVAGVFPQRLVTRMVEDESSELFEKFDKCCAISADLVGYTKFSHSVRDPATIFALIDAMVTRMDELAASCGLEAGRSVGDAYEAFASEGTVLDPESAEGSPAKRIASFAVQLPGALAEILPPELSIRIGIATGSATGGVLGTMRLGFEVWGDAWEQARLVEQGSQAGKVLCDGETAQQLVADGGFVVTENKDGEEGTFWVDVGSSRTSPFASE